MSIIKKRFLFYLPLFVLAYFPIFHQLGKNPTKAWDESLYAMRAYHLASTGTQLKNFTEFPGITDYPNLKPPLGNYFQALSFRLFGDSEWALRLPIALFVLMSLVLIMAIPILDGNPQGGQELEILGSLGIQ